jgi:UDP-N-acetylmuramyl tripeptide synthase
VIIKEDGNLRGRASGEIARLIGEGLREGGLAADHIEVVHDEAESVTRVMAMLEDGDLALVLATDVRAVLDQLGAMGATA